jgi:hypothetical protein
LLKENAMLKRLLRKMTSPSAPGNDFPLLFPIGHFYSPIADTKDLIARKARLWNQPNEIQGIDLRVNEQLVLLEKLKPHTREIEYPVEKPRSNQTTYYYSNDQYPVLDAEFLHAALLHFKPSQVIEVGSGFSSLITAQVNRTLLKNSVSFTCIEPYPRQFLLDGVPGITHLLQQKVEDVDLAVFDRLDRGDILFIDSSHVSKTGSDVNFLFFEVLPRLKPGVLVHIHDIFLPDEYPEKWVIDEGRHWNEQYILRAFMQFNSAWRVVWSAHYMGTRHTAAVQNTFPRFPALGGGGSFWIERI